MLSLDEVNSCNLTYLPEPVDLPSLKLRMETFKRLLRSVHCRSEGGSCEGQKFSLRT